MSDLIGYPMTVFLIMRLKSGLILNEVSQILRKSAFLHMRQQKGQISCSVTAQSVDQALCFRYTESTVHLRPKCKLQASSHHLWLYNPEDRFSRGAV